MSGTLGAELREIANAATAFERSRQTVGAQWRDSVYQSLDRRALTPLAAEVRHFRSSVTDVGANLDEALRLLED
jgi:hypothetical protein